MIQELMNRADQRGYVTFAEVMELLEADGEDDPGALETILEELDELGIELRQHEGEDDDYEGPPDSALDEFSDSEFETIEIEETLDASLGDISAVSADDPVGLYFRQMAQEPLLTADEEIELAKRIELGREAQIQLRIVEVQFSGSTRRTLNCMVEDGQAAREHLGRANTRLVVSIAKRYMGQGLPFPDLIQEGNVGLMRAVDKYDYKRGNRFSTYATWWIRQAITRALAQKNPYHPYSSPYDRTDSPDVPHGASSGTGVRPPPHTGGNRRRNGFTRRSHPGNDGRQPARYRPGTSGWG